MKQSIKMNPISFEYKIWCTNLLFGYLFDFTIYEGSTGRKIDNITNFGLDAGVVLDIIDGLPVNSDGNLKPMLLSVDFSQKHPYYRYFESGLLERSSEEE